MIKVTIVDSAHQTWRWLQEVAAEVVEESRVGRLARLI